MKIAMHALCPFTTSNAVSFLDSLYDSQSHTPSGSSYLELGQKGLLTSDINEPIINRFLERKIPVSLAIERMHLFFYRFDGSGYAKSKLVGGNLFISVVQSL